MILSQLMDEVELQNLSPEDLRTLILKLDEQIKYGTGRDGEKVLVTIEATVIGVKDDKPAGDPEFIRR
jgi:hypothetical protein